MGMPTFADVLEGDLVTPVGSDVAARTFRIRIGSLATVITIRVGKRRGPHGRYEYTASHAIRTPEQLGPYLSSVPFGDTPEEALAKAIDDLTIFYSAGVEAGHEPAESWLVPRRWSG